MAGVEVLCLRPGELADDLVARHLCLTRRVRADDVGERHADHLGLEVEAGVGLDGLQKRNGVGVLREKVGELPSSISSAVLSKKFDKDVNESYAK